MDFEIKSNQLNEVNSKLDKSNDVKKTVQLNENDLKIINTEAFNNAFGNYYMDQLNLGKSIDDDEAFKIEYLSIYKATLETPKNENSNVEIVNIETKKDDVKTLDEKPKSKKTASKKRKSSNNALPRVDKNGIKLKQKSYVLTDEQEAKLSALCSNFRINNRFMIANLIEQAYTDMQNKASELNQKNVTALVFDMYKQIKDLEKRLSSLEK